MVQTLVKCVLPQMETDKTLLQAFHSLVAIFSRDNLVNGYKNKLKSCLQEAAVLSVFLG